MPNHDHNHDHGDGHGQQNSGTAGDDMLHTTRGGVFAFAGNDTIMATAQNGFGQIHTYGATGNDVNVMGFAQITSFSHGHHVRGGTGSDIFNFVNTANVQSTIIGRIEDFDPTQDTLMIEGQMVDFNNLPANVRVVEFNGMYHDQSAVPQQWLLIETAGGGHIFYAIEGARVDMTTLDQQEGHFLMAEPDFAALVDVIYEDRENYIPAGAAPDGGAVIQDTDVVRADVEAAIVDTSGGDLIAAGLNDDRVLANLGNDQIWGGSGNDFVFSGLGNDTVSGGIGDDTLRLGADNDHASGGKGDDVIVAGAGDDTVDGGLGNDRLMGAAGNDFLAAAEGDDTAEGGIGNDILRMGAGNDTAYGGDGDDYIVGGAGWDMLTGGAGNDMVMGAAGNDMLNGDAGDDTLDGGELHDVLNGGEGRDILTGGAGRDAFIFTDFDWGFDVVADYNRSEDQIKFGGTVNGAEDLILMNYMYQGELSTLIRFADENGQMVQQMGGVVLAGVTVDDVDPGDFVF